MQCVFAASLGTLFAAIYFRTGNLWVTVFLHGAMDIASMLVGGLYGTEDVAESISGYDASMMLSILIYLIPTLFLLRKKKNRRGGALLWPGLRPGSCSGPRRKTGNGSGKPSCLLKQKGLQSVKANRETNTSIRRRRYYGMYNASGW